MSYCLNPNCPRPSSNSVDVKFCTGCGFKLLLAERYRATKQIGQGGFGRTFLASDEYKPKKPRCVIKQFFPIAQGTNNVEKASELFKVEAAQLDELGDTHSQIPELLAYFTQDNQQYLVQEFIDGQNLADEITQNGTFSEDQIIALLNNLLPVLQFVHSKQVIHRDIKPENIIRSSDGELVLVDFGAAKTINPTALSVTGTVIGTAGYAPPEQAVGKATFASDIYSLGVTCLNLLTQIQPFELFDVMEGEWVWRNYLNTPVSDNLGQVLDKMISGAVKHRYQTAIEVMQALNPPQSATPTVPVSVPDNLNSDVGVGYTRLGYLFLEVFQFETVKLKVVNKGFLPFKSGIESDTRTGKARYFVEDMGYGVTLEMVEIPGCRFTMGASTNEKGSSERERPQHEVTVENFFMGKYLITQEQWARVANSFSLVNRELNPRPSKFKGNDRLPVEGVSWCDAVEFCARLAKKTSRNYRLPSEAEWEYACRAGSITPFHFGETMTTEVANYNGNYIYGNALKGVYREKTTPVGSFPPNAFGLYDMHGNLWEWCADHWHENYEGAPKNGSARLSDNDNQFRLMRGGSWSNNPVRCRSAIRKRDSPRYRYDYIGFRVVCGAAARTF